MSDLVQRMQDVLQPTKSWEERIMDIPDALNDRDAVWKALEILQVRRVTVAFSGGNDEGGAEEVLLEFLDGTTRDVREGVHVLPAKDWHKAAAELADALELPVYDRFGSFNGEPCVEGTVTWDVATRKVTAAYDASYTEWYHEEEEL